MDSCADVSVKRHGRRHRVALKAAIRCLKFIPFMSVCYLVFRFRTRTGQCLTLAKVMDYVKLPKFIVLKMLICRHIKMHVNINLM